MKVDVHPMIVEGVSAAIPPIARKAGIGRRLLIEWETWCRNRGSLFYARADENDEARKIHGMRGDAL